jgi:hypothetical protein
MLKSTNFFLLFLTLLIFNLSIDVKDQGDINMKEDLTINDQESIVELVLEKWFGFENAIAEHDEHDEQDGGSIDCQKIVLINLSYKQNISHKLIITIFDKNPLILFKENYVKAYSLEIDSPPPKFDLI